MEFGSYQRGVDWLKEHGFDDAFIDPRNNTIPWAGFVIDPDSGRKTATARVLCNEILASGEVVLIVDDNGVWPSCEYEHLFTHYRDCTMEAHGVDDSPTRIFQAADRDFLMGMVALSLYFCWGVVLADSEGLIIRTSHDEWLQAGSFDSKRLDAAAETLRSFGLRPFSQPPPQEDAPDGLQEGGPI